MKTMKGKCYNITIGTVEDMRAYRASGVLNTTHLNTFAVMADDPDDACNWLVETGRMDINNHLVMLVRENRMAAELETLTLEQLLEEGLIDPIDLEDDEEDEEL